MKSSVDRSALKQFTQLTGSTFVMTALQFVVSVILTRAMDPEAYATYKLILNTNLLIQGLLTFGIPVTLSFILTSENVNVNKYIGLGLKIGFISSLIGTLLSFALLFIQQGTGLLAVDNIALYFSPLCFIPLMLYYTEYICIGTNDIKLLSRQKMLVQVFMAAILLICWKALTRIDLWVSMAVYVISNIAVIAYLFVKFKAVYKTDTGMVKNLFHINRTVGLQTYIGALFSIVSVRALNVIVDAYITRSEYALFSLAVTISSPLGPFISTIGSVMFKKFNKLNEMGKRFIIIIISITALAAIVYVIGVQALTPLIFGEFYRGSIGYAQVLGVGSLLVGLGDVFNRFVMAKGNGRYIRNSAIITGVVNVALGAALIKTLQAVGVTISTVACNLAYLLLMIISYKLVVSRAKRKKPEGLNNRTGEQ